MLPFTLSCWFKLAKNNFERPRTYPSLCVFLFPLYLCLLLFRYLTKSFFLCLCLPFFSFSVHLFFFLSLSLSFHPSTLMSHCHSLSFFHYFALFVKDSPKLSLSFFSLSLSLSLSFYPCPTQPIFVFKISLSFLRVHFYLGRYKAYSIYLTEP